MDGSSAPAVPLGQQFGLQTLVAVIQSAVQAQNLIATNLNNLVSAFAVAFPPPLTSSLAFDPPNLISGASESTTVTVAGAVVGQFVTAAFSLSLQGISLSAFVSAANTVTVVFSNLTGGAIDLGSGIIKVSVRTT